ncbi:hypothetical protein [Heliophilum fasciatum]|uniref:Uncharacterized protein n=1 Tax=Heliophilum fasciatum TaxID=35700 RepID=A0A4R2RY02_9FIRM|nr:hypothetical protein [Heliophilum fasciatum]MCW2277086.1 hypothetical protein [Heliophilum fasciatum]TCP68388.1 hypothetical protein EDD73_10317 [Heliophilum fasciatum]
MKDKRQRPVIAAGSEGEALESTIDGALSDTVIPWELQKGWYDLAAQIRKGDDDYDDNDAWNMPTSAMEERKGQFTETMKASLDKEDGVIGNNR